MQLPSKQLPRIVIITADSSKRFIHCIVSATQRSHKHMVFNTTQCALYIIKKEGLNSDHIYNTSIFV